MRSMTGFGRAARLENGREITVEVRSVNSRYLDLNYRLPHVINGLDETVRTLVGEACNRGKVDVYVNYRNTREDRAQVQIDIPLAKSYLAAAQQLGEALSMEHTMDFKDVLGFHGIVTMGEIPEDIETVKVLLTVTLREALGVLSAMREKEGGQLREDLEEKLATMVRAVTTLEGYAPQTEIQHRERLFEKLKEFIQGDETQTQRVLTEAALIAEKRSIDEEIVRLKSHFTQVRETLTMKEPVGRKLDFIVQEMNREVNTIGSKANDGEIAQVVITLKSELEKIREQIQNIE